MGMKKPIRSTEFPNRIISRSRQQAEVDTTEKGTKTMPIEEKHNSTVYRAYTQTRDVSFWSGSAPGLKSFFLPDGEFPTQAQV